MKFELQENQTTKLGDAAREKIKMIQPKLDEFIEKVDNIFSPEEASKIRAALNLMIELHIDQRDRPDNQPYLVHPLEIAMDLIDKYEIRDYELIIAALLHDSIEDQSKKLANKRLGGDSTGQGKEKIKEIALLEIQELFGERIERILIQISSPNFNKLKKDLQADGINKTINELYKEHIEEIINNPDVFVIKFADFARNALSLDNWPPGKEIKTLIGKYGPVIKEVFIPAFENMNQSHPLYKMKDEMLNKMNKEYDKYYK